jgi:hypothetical protein
VTRKKFLAARTYHGKPFIEFLKTLYDSMEMPDILRGGQSSAIDDAMSPQRPQARKGRVEWGYLTCESGRSENNETSALIDVRSHESNMLDMFSEY